VLGGRKREREESGGEKGNKEVRGMQRREGDKERSK
jgi:hypothetical protein